MKAVSTHTQFVAAAGFALCLAAFLASPAWAEEKRPTGSGLRFQGPPSVSSDSETGSHQQPPGNTMKFSNPVKQEGGRTKKSAEVGHTLRFASPSSNESSTEAPQDAAQR